MEITIDGNPEDRYDLVEAREAYGAGRYTIVFLWEDAPATVPESLRRMEVKPHFCAGFTLCARKGYLRLLDGAGWEDDSPRRDSYEEEGLEYDEEEGEYYVPEELLLDVGELVECPACGDDQAEDAVFCASCGAAMEEAAEEELAESEREAAPSAAESPLEALKRRNAERMSRIQGDVAERNARLQERLGRGKK